MTPSWYQPLSLVINFYVGFVCFLFLVRPPKAYRTIAWVGLMIISVGIMFSALRVLRRVALPGGILPKFSSQLDAVTSMVTPVAFAIGITIWFIAARRERRSHSI